MTEVRKLMSHEIPAFIDIVTNAYTGIMENTSESKERLIKMYIDTQEQNDSIDLYGVFRNDELVGGMRLHTFEINYKGETLQAGGIGLVAVDLLHKKEKVAKDIISYFIDHMNKLQVPILTLYPFRPDFYLKMGFGYGTKINQYQFLPTALPNHYSKKNLQFLSIDDSEKLRVCFNTFSSNNHGMIFKQPFEMKRLFHDPNKRIVGFYNDEKIDSYVSFTFKKMSDTNFCLNNLVIDEFIYNSSEGFLTICSFLHSQGDQINRIVYNTQDDSFHHVLVDPRNDTNEMIPSVYHESHTSGVGIMYRINDLERIITLQADNLSRDVTCKMKIVVEDSFLGDEKIIYLNIFEGKIEINSPLEYDFEMRTDMATLSSLLMGSVDFHSLVRYGKVQCSNHEFKDICSQLFNSDSKPICMTLF